MNNILTKVNTVKLQFRDQITECKNPLSPLEITDFVRFCYKANKQVQIINCGEHIEVFTKDKMYRFVNYKNYIMKLAESGTKTFYKKS